MNYQLLALDLDGTLTNSRKEITPSTRDALIDIQKNGKKVVLASGRPSQGVFSLFAGPLRRPEPPLLDPRRGTAAVETPRPCGQIFPIGLSVQKYRLCPRAYHTKHTKKTRKLRRKPARPIV